MKIILDKAESSKILRDYFAQLANIEDTKNVQVELIDDEFIVPTELTCSSCGCTDSRACTGGCHWVHEEDQDSLCSACAQKQSDTKFSTSKQLRSAAAAAVKPRRKYTHHKKKVKTSRDSWSEKELRILKDQYATKSAKDLSKILGKTAANIYKRAEILGLRKQKRKPAEPMRKYDKIKQETAARYSPPTMVRRDEDEEYMRKQREDLGKEKPMLDEDLELEG